MVSDQEIASCVESVLRQHSAAAAADPASGAGTFSFAGVLQQLEAKLGTNLSHKAAFIRDQIGLLLHSATPNPSPKDHFALQHQPALHHPFQQHQQFLFHQQQQQQQQQHHAQQHHAQQHHVQQHQQGYALHPQLMSRHQIPSQPSPFDRLPHQHEFVFQSAPPPAQAQQLRHQQQAAAAAAAAALQSQNGQFAAGAAPAPPAAKPSAQSGVKRKGGTGGLSKVCGVSPELQAIVGEPALPRTQIVKQLWAYIRKNNLQDPNNKRKIICNDELRLVFETDSTDMFQMNKLLAKHIRPLESTTTNEAGSDTKRSKASEETPATESEPDNRDYTIVISDALSEFFGTGEREMLQSEATKRVWDYIKLNQLEDPSNAMVILFDEKLKKLFGCESLSALGVSELLARHLAKKS